MDCNTTAMGETKNKFFQIFIIPVLLNSAETLRFNGDEIYIYFLRKMYGPMNDQKICSLFNDVSKPRVHRAGHVIRIGLHNAVKRIFRERPRVWSTWKTTDEIGWCRKQPTTGEQSAADRYHFQTLSCRIQDDLMPRTCE